MAARRRRSCLTRHCFPRPALFPRRLRARDANPASRTDLQVGYLNLLQLNDEQRAARGCTPIDVGGIEAFTRWAEARARHKPSGSRSSPGRALGTLEEPCTAQSQLIPCAEHECGALVHLLSTRAQARNAGRSIIAKDDGCGRGTARAATPSQVAPPAAKLRRQPICSAGHGSSCCSRRRPTREWACGRRRASLQPALPTASFPTPPPRPPRA